MVVINNSNKDNNNTNFSDNNDDNGNHNINKKIIDGIMHYWIDMMNK